MSQRILVPLDTSPLAEVVLPYVEDLVKGPDAEVILLTVCEPEGQKVERLLREYLEKVASVLHVKGARVRQDVVFGKPADEILDYAARVKVDLIAMASRGLSGMSRWVRGSTAEKVLRQALLPVFLVQTQDGAKARGGWSARRILLPLDGSQTAECVFGFVQEVFDPQRLELVLINVVELPQPLATPAAPGWKDYSGYVMSRLGFVAQSYLSKVEKHFKGQGWRVSYVIRRATPVASSWSSLRRPR